MKRISIFLFLCLMLAELRAQDPQFSQFYAAPIYHNPAFTGASQKGRFISNFRSQWSGTFITSSFSADNFIKKYNSGVGLIATIDRQGTAGLYTLYSSLNYAYEVSLSSDWAARGGLAFGIINRGFNTSKIITGSQLEINGNVRPQTDQLAGIGSPVLKFDVSSGFLIYNKYFWIGGSAMHMSRPNLSLVDSVNITASDRRMDEARVPVLYTLMTGFKIPLEKRLYGSDYGNRYIEKTITPTIIYKQQGFQMRQLDFGAYVTIKPLVFGLYYRDIPFFKDVERGYYQRDALIFLLGFKHDYISAGYSFDLNVSRLGGSAGNTHELSFSYEFENPKRRKRRAPPIPCPKF